MSCLLSRSPVEESKRSPVDGSGLERGRARGRVRGRARARAGKCRNRSKFTGLVVRGHVARPLKSRAALTHTFGPFRYNGQRSHEKYPFEKLEAFGLSEVRDGGVGPRGML